MRLFLLGLILAGCTKAAAPTIDPAATVRFITPPIDGDVAAIMSAQRSKSKAEGRQVLLYCGASWCEPCRFFHEAVDRGELTGKLGALDLVAFDAQVDAERMLMANYESQFIPLFAAVGPDGKGTGKKIEGSVKGPGAVDDLLPKLKGLLAEAPR